MLLLDVFSSISSHACIASVCLRLPRSLLLVQADKLCVCMYYGRMRSSVSVSGFLIRCLQIIVSFEVMAFFVVVIQIWEVTASIVTAHLIRINLKKVYYDNIPGKTGSLLDHVSCFTLSID